MPRRPDPAWLDTQYNNRARITEHPAIFDRWQRASALAREQSSCRLDIAYGPHSGQTLDLFPTPRANAPVMVFIHGGWWRSLDKRDHSFIAPVFTQAGALVVVPNYALCPAVGIETIALQMVDALVWTFDHAARYGGDPRNIVVVGHSAGGHLAAMLLNCRWKDVAARLPARLVNKALAISGVFDLAPIAKTPFLQDDLRLAAPMAKRLSPVLHPAPKGRLYALAGANESEEFLRQNQSIRDAWGARVVPVCETVPGTNHLDVVHELADPSARLHGLALELLGLREPAAWAAGEARPARGARVA